MLAVHRPTGLVKVLSATAAVILFGGANELIQPLFGREGSLRDFLSNLEGTGGVAVLWVAAGLVWLLGRNLYGGRR